MAPFHKMNENPTLLFQQDMQLIEMLDGLGFHSASTPRSSVTGWPRGSTLPCGCSRARSSLGIANEIAAEHGRQMDPGRLRLVVNLRLAETRE